MASDQPIMYELFLFLDLQFQEIDLILPDGGRVHYTRISPGTGTANAVFEHMATPSLFFKSRIQEVNNTLGTNPQGWHHLHVLPMASVPLLQSIKDRYGNKISIARGRADHGKVTRVISPNGRWLEYTLDRG